MPIEPSPAVERALDIISFLADRPDRRFSLSELARQVGLPRATCNAVVLALAERGVLIRHEPGLEYSLGPALISFGEAARDGLPILALVGKELEPLASTVGLSAIAAMRAGDETVVASVVNLDDPLGVMVRPGQTMPMVPPFGATFVAWAGDEQIDAWLDRAGDLRPAERDRYRAALAVVRQRGYSVTVNVGVPTRPRRDLFERREQLIRALVHTEYLPDKLDRRPHRITQMSAPVFDHRGELAVSLMLLGPQYELTADDIAQLGEQLRAAAGRVTERIGGTAPDFWSRTGRRDGFVTKSRVRELQIERQAGALGAVVTGVDLAQPIDDDTFGAIKATFLEHQVICIRGQAAMTPDDQLAFAARWGEISIHPYVPSIEGYSGIMRIYDPNPVTVTWHADTTHAAAPPALTLLLARVLPPYGGDTMFSSAYLAYEGLSPGLRMTIDGLRAVHKGTELAADAGLDQEAVTTTHPVVRTHPETGRRALFVNGNYTSHFEGWTAEESAPLLQYLYAQVGRPEYTYRHRWQEGDLIIWDNRCTQHAVVGDTGGAERTLHRVTIAGDVPV